MRRFVLLSFLAVAALSVPLEAEAGDTYLGSIVSAGPVTNNSTTASPFTIADKLTAGANRISVQCSAPTYVAMGTSSVVATANNVQLDTNQLYDIVVESLWTTVSILPVSGSSTCKVYSTVK